MLSDKLKLKILEIILKVRKSNTIEEVRDLNNQLKKIDFYNRKGEITKKIIDKYKR